MSSTDWLMALKVGVLVAAGVAFVWWQFHDLAQERRRTQQRDSQRSKNPNTPDSN
jgi:hypothetical protein